MNSTVYQANKVKKILLVPNCWYSNFKVGKFTEMQGIDLPLNIYC